MNRTLPRNSSWRNKSRQFRNKSSDDTDPLLGLINLFDANMVLVVAMLLSLIAKGNVADMAARLSQQDVTIVTNPGKPDMEMVIKRGNKIEKLKATGETGRGAGQPHRTPIPRLNCEVVYVPEGESKQ